MADRPNIVLIQVDQWRGDCLSIAGHPTVHTPRIDQLALDGVRFNHAYSASPTCIAARAALFTGLTPRSHGRVGYQDGVAWDYPVTLAGEFTRGGYQTQAIGKMHVHPHRSQVGFQNVILHDGYLHHGRDRTTNISTADDYLPWLREQIGRDADYFDHGVGCNSINARPWDKEEYLHPTNWLVSQSVDFLRRRDTRKPFFLYMSFHRPHPPYDPPAWAFEMYLNREMPAPPMGDWVDVLAPHAAPYWQDLFVGKIDPRILQRARAGYYGHMTHIDHQLNRFCELLQEHRLDGNTVICFTSDHGEMIGDHSLFRKGFPYEGSARVPLVLKAPMAGLARGTAIDSAVEQRDIMPTLLECAGLPIPSCVEGTSFLPLARGEKPAWRPYIHGEHCMFGGSMQWLTDGREKYVWMSWSGREQLFDLTCDPLELHDLAARPEMAGRLTAWRQRMIQELTGREEGFTDGQKLIPGRPVRPTLGHLRRSAGVE